MCAGPEMTECGRDPLAGARRRAQPIADVVVLSPHLDDAVLAVGALIGRLAAQGRRVQVCTAFTSGPSLERIPRRHRAFGDYRVRIAEDDRALDRLGAGHRRLGLRERIWRDPPVRSLAGAFRSPDGVGALSALPTLVDVVRGLLAPPRVELYAPLGVGHHVDHVEVALAALEATIACGALTRVAFYEDFYALGEAFRRRHPVTRQRTWSIPDVPGWAAPLGGLALRLGALMPRGPSLDDYLPTIRTMTWRCEPQEVGDFEDIKLAAISEYRTQTAKLGGMSRIEALLRRAHRVRGGELVWRAAASSATPRSG